jgi:DNA-binding response OmpR family regulator
MARILVIDDDEFVRSFVVRALERDGHEVKTAPEGEAGLELHRSASFDLLITDILMPGMEGIELIVALREENPGTPILAISGGGGVTGASGPLQDAQLLGADASLAKPFEVEALQRVVNGLLERAPSHP